METTVPADEAEPYANFFFKPVPLFLLIFLIACQHSGKEVKKTIPMVRTDSTRAIAKKPVLAVAKPRKPVKQKKKIYLTFDDGPNKGTRNVLDIVQQENVPVTFSLSANMFLPARGNARFGTA